LVTQRMLEMFKKKTAQGAEQGRGVIP